jgi:peptide-methionine (S)-S-oxide reductase
VRYNFYKAACGRERRLEEVWGDKAGGLAGQR